MQRPGDVHRAQPCCRGLLTHPINGTCSLPLPRSSTSTGQSNQMAGGDQSVERREGNQPKVPSESGGRAKPGCAGCRPPEPWRICTGSLVPLSQRADSDQAGSSKTELAQIPRFIAHYLHFGMLMFICPNR